MTFDVGRLIRHLFAPRARRRFPDALLSRIATDVAHAEVRHRGEICFAVEHALSPLAVLRGQTARDRAQAVFAQLRVWDTEGDIGVLVYLLLADRRIEIVADRGLDAVIGTATWRTVCARMEARMAAGDVEGAASVGIAAVSDLLAEHIPRIQGVSDRDELPNRPRIL